MAFLRLKPGGIHQRGHLGKKEGGRNILPPFGVLKSLAELAARRRQKNKIIFRSDMRVEKILLRLQALWQKNEAFSPAIFSETG